MRYVVSTISNCQFVPSYYETLFKPRKYDLWGQKSVFSLLFFLQLRNLLTRSILGYVDVFADHRKLPRIEMELILQGGFPIEIEFQISLLITYSLAIFMI